MEEIKETKKGGSNIALVLAILVILCLVGYICYDKILAPADKTNTSASSEVKKSNNTKADTCDCDCEEVEKSSDTAISSTKYCDGEYYGEYSKVEGSFQINEKVTYYLKKDGTFEADFSGVSGSKGVYVINDNTITFIGTKEIVGPRDQDNYYSSSDFVIADDCSYFFAPGSENKLIKK